MRKKQPKIEESQFQKEQRKLRKQYDNKMKWNKIHHRGSTFWYIMTAIVAVAAVLLLNIIGLILVVPIVLIGWLIGKGLSRLAKRRYEEAMAIGVLMQQNAFDATAQGANLNNPKFQPSTTNNDKNDNSNN